jgi:hypothetical protein
VAVIEQAVSTEAAVGGIEGRGFLELAPGAADPRRGIDDDAVRFDQTGIDQRLEREDRGGRVAARGRDGLGAAQGVAVELGNPVDERA